MLVVVLVVWVVGVGLVWVVLVLGGVVCVGGGCVFFFGDRGTNGVWAGWVVGGVRCV